MLGDALVAGGEEVGVAHRPEVLEEAAPLTRRYRVLRADLLRRRDHPDGIPHRPRGISVRMDHRGVVPAVAGAVAVREEVRLGATQQDGDSGRGAPRDLA